MLRILRSCVLTALVFATSAALASFHTFRIEQIYSNADGTVQFVVMREAFSTNGEHLWANQSLTSSDGTTTKVLTFMSNLPSPSTAGRRVLIATPGFAALGLVTPNYTIQHRLPADRQRHPQLRRRRSGELCVAAHQRHPRDRPQRDAGPECRDQLRGRLGVRRRDCADRARSGKGLMVEPGRGRHRLQLRHQARRAGDVDVHVRRGRAFGVVRRRGPADRKRHEVQRHARQVPRRTVPHVSLYRPADAGR